MSPGFNCNKCGKSISEIDEMKNHAEVCMEEFLPAQKSKVCRYYARGECWKGNQCLFVHPKSSQEEHRVNIPLCSNGLSCRFLMSGVCRYFHPGIGVQHPTWQSQQQEQHQQEQYQKKGRWCRFLEDCWRVPNCPFTHYDQDFPKLPKVNKPQESSNLQDWMDY